MRDTETKFPKNIDDRIFFQDIHLDQVPIMEHYNSLLDKSDYTSASEFLNNSEAFFYGAWILNQFEKRLANLETYLMKLPPKEPLVSHQSSEPASAAAGTHWTSTEADTHDIGTWSAASHYTCNELSNYTWKQVGKL